MQNNKEKLGELLLKVKKIDKEQLDSALEEQKTSKKKLGEILIEKGFVTKQDIYEVLEFQLGIPYISLDDYQIDKNVVKMVPENIARKNELLALKTRNNYIVVAMADPLDMFAIDDIKLTTGYDVQPVICKKDEILNAIERYYREDVAKKVVEEFVDSYESTEIDEENDNIKLENIDNAPIVKLVNSIISEAVKMRASDIHIEPFEDDLRVRYRIDGDLQEIMKLSIKSHPPIVTRIKIMGRMDIAEKRLPQDGRVESIVNEKQIDMRLSTLPTVYGEKVVIRLLDRSSFLFSKEDLGFKEKDLEQFNKILRQPYGIILVTGPTGSGKTTTLYAVLRELNTIDKNIITVEDPVEYKLEGINQVQVNNKAGLTFASGLRSILRQDPDIIMVGEIRDAETAEIAVRAAITGHLVLSTLHTNDTASTVARLIDMGIEPYMVSSSVVGIISQRLVKKLCDNCKIPYKANDLEKKLLGKEENENIILYKPGLCNKCVNGYKGRTGIQEVMPINEEIRRLISDSATTDEIKNEAVLQGMLTLEENCKDLVLNGTTTIDEMIRVGYTLE